VFDAILHIPPQRIAARCEAKPLVLRAAISHQHKWRPYARVGILATPGDQGRERAAKPLSAADIGMRRYRIDCAGRNRNSGVRANRPV
jgi:hypothetical protein